MLYYEALQQLTHDRAQEREREAQGERLAREVCGRRYRRRRRLALAAGLGLLRGGRQRAQRAGV